MVSISDSSSWRLIERSSYTSVTKKITTTTEPIDCDDYTSDYQRESQQHIPVKFEEPSNEGQKDDVCSVSSFSSVRPAPSCFPRASAQQEIDVASEGRRCPSRARYPYCGPLVQSEQPSPGSTLKHQGTMDRRPSYPSLHPAPSVADISQYSMGEEKAVTLHMCSNMILLVASLLLIGTGAGLMGYYRIHMLEIITIEFFVVPLFMLVGGVFAFFTAIVGFYATMKQDACLLITHAVFMAIQFCLLVAGIISAVRLIFFIQTGMFNADIASEMNLYETNSWIRYKWDTLQREFACCGGFTYNLGYTDWKHSMLGGQLNSVPDSCCLRESHHCGRGVFEQTDPKKIFMRIHTHGCITIMTRRLEDHVIIILIVFAGVGGILAVMELLSIVLACCFANQIEKNENPDYWDNEVDYRPPSRNSNRPGTPATLRAANNETTF